MDDDIFNSPFGKMMEVKKKKPGKPAGMTTKKSNILPKGQQTMNSFFKKSNEESPEKLNIVSSNSSIGSSLFARTRARTISSALHNSDNNNGSSEDDNDNDKLPVSKSRTDKYKASDIKKPTPPNNKKIPFLKSPTTTTTNPSKRPSALTGATIPIIPITTKSTNTAATEAKGKRKKDQDDKDDYTDFIPSTTKFSNYSLDDILKEKSEKGAFLENVDTDSLLFRKDDPNNKKQKLKDNPKIDVKNILSEHDFKKEEIDQLQTLIVAPDLFLEESFQKCIDTAEIIPDVMRISFSPGDLLKYPILQLIGTPKTFNYAILNTLFCMVDISRPQDIPTVLINYLFSIVCYGKNDIIVSQAYELINSINFKLFGGSLISNHFSFNDFFSVFKSYKIKMDFDSINDFKDTSKSFSSSSSTVNYTFPTINLYRLLCLLNTTITGDGLNKFTIYQVKEMIKFLILLSLDPNFLPKIPMNQSNITTASGKKSLSTIPQPLHKDDVTNNTKLLNRISLLKSILNILLNHYFDEKSHNKNTTTNDSNNNQSTRETTETTTGFKLEESMNELFEEIISLVDVNSNFRFSLYTKIAQTLPTDTPSRVYERFSLYCIYRLLEQDKQNKEIQKEKRKQRKLKKSRKLSKKSNKSGDNENNPTDTNDDDKMKIDDASNSSFTTTPITLSQEVINITNATTTSTSPSSQDNVFASSQDNNNNNNNNSNEISSQDNNVIPSSQDNIGIASSQDNNVISSSQEQNTTVDSLSSINNNNNPSTTIFLPSQPINVIDLLKSKDIIESLIQLISNFVFRIRNDDINEVIMVNLVQLVRLTIDDVFEIKKHTSEIENVIRTWNTRIKEPDTIDFNRSRIKDTLVLIQSKISGLIINKITNTIDNYFAKV